MLSRNCALVFSRLGVLFASFHIGYGAHTRCMPTIEFEAYKCPTVLSSFPIQIMFSECLTDTKKNCIDYEKWFCIVTFNTVCQYLSSLHVAVCLDGVHWS